MLLHSEFVTAAADAAVEGLTPLDRNGYKPPLLRGLVLRSLQQLSGR